MPIEPLGPAPYAPPATVLTTLKWHWQKGLPTPITTEVIERIVESESLAPRVTKTLRLFELVDDEGQPTPQFQELAHAPTEDDFKARLAAIVQVAYADVIQYIDFDTVSTEQIEGQFRRYTPRGQVERMAVLFRGLCLYTGLMAGSSDEAHTVMQPTRNRRPKPATPRTPKGGGDGDQGSKEREDAPPPVALTDAKSRYLNLLLKQADENPTPELFDRIERVLGVAPTSAPGKGAATPNGKGGEGD
jgi:hypothetical protein